MAARSKKKTEQKPTTLTATPSGIQIAYFTDPRGYKVFKGEPGVIQPWEPEVPGWMDVPSVTTVLDVLDKPALSWWGMRVGIKGLFELWDKGLVAATADGRLAATVNAVWEYADPSDGGNVEALLTQNKLTTNHVRDQAAERGTAAHAALEEWAKTGEHPDPTEHPPEEFQYLVALVKFLVDMGDAWETGGVEVAVGSVEHKFAGRYDLRGRVLRDVKLVNRSLTKDGKSVLARGHKHILIPAGTRILLDAKTSKSIYKTHLIQLEAYEGASVECGYEPTDMRAVLHLSGLGEYQFFPDNASYEDFLAVRHVYDAMARVEEALK